MARLRFWMSLILGVPAGIIAGYAIGNAWGDSTYLGCNLSCFVSSIQGPAIGILATPIIIFLMLTLFWRPKVTCDPEEPLDSEPTIDH